jgi:hypothetical protein
MSKAEEPRPKPPADPRRQREEQLAAALRANLRRRKGAAPKPSDSAED